MYDQDVDRSGVGSGLAADLCGRLDLQIGSVTNLARAVAERARRPPAQPVFGRVATSGVAATGSSLILTFPLKGPDQGHFWYVRSIVVGGLSPTVAAAGRADIYVSAATLHSPLASIGLADWRDERVSLPDVAFYGRGELPLRLNEELIVIVTGGTNGQVYVAAAQFEDFEEGVVPEGWSA